MDKVLSFAESKQYLNFHPTELSLKNEMVELYREQTQNDDNYTVDVKGNNATTVLLGLTEKDLFIRIENELDYLNNSKKIILSSIESQLIKQCEDIAKMYHYIGEGILFFVLKKKKKRKEKKVRNKFKFFI